MKINCVVTDDEPIAREILESYIGRLPQLTLVRSCSNAVETFEALYQYPVDVIFLDIQMPVITGTQFLYSLRRPPLVVFTTAYPKYAAEGLELNAVDYLLKPITFERFGEAVEQIKERLPQKQGNAQANLPKADYIFIKQDFRLVRVSFAEIRFIQAERDFSLVFMESKKLMASMHLKLFEEILPVSQFMRVHRSYMVNLDKIQSIKGNVVEIGNTGIPIGANYKEALYRRLRI